MLAQPLLKPLYGKRYELVEDYEILGEVIPKGYITNGANIPRILWAVIPPNKSDFMSAVLYHDYFCDKEEYLKADNGLEEILTLVLKEKEELKIDIWYEFIQVKLMLVGVRLYHIIKEFCFE